MCVVKYFLYVCGPVCVLNFLAVPVIVKEELCRSGSRSVPLSSGFSIFLSKMVPYSNFLFGTWCPGTNVAPE